LAWFEFTGGCLLLRHFLPFIPFRLSQC
jgi:hypothetical protein